MTKRNRSKKKNFRNIIIITAVIFILALGAAGGILLHNYLSAGSIEKNIEAGNTYVNQGKFNEAKSAYEVSDSATFNMVQFGDSGISMQEVSYTYFKDAVTGGTSNSGPNILCWITISDNIVTDIEEQYRP